MVLLLIIEQISPALLAMLSWGNSSECGFPIVIYNNLFTDIKRYYKSGPLMPLASVLMLITSCKCISLNINK
jgi:hypothetical protein